MRVEDLLEELKEQYPISFTGIDTQSDLIKAKAQQELIAHIELLVTAPPPKKKG